MNGEATSVEEGRSETLAQTRRQDRAAKETAGPKGPGKTSPPQTPAVPQAPLLLLGAAKDLLDWVLDLIGLGEIPLIGQIPGILFTVFNVLYLSQRGLLRQSGWRGTLSLGALTLDNLPLINNLPLSAPAMWFIRQIQKRVPSPQK